MSALLNFHGHLQSLRIECANDDSTIWIRSSDATVSLDMTPTQRAKLRAALDAADAFDVLRMIGSIDPAKAGSETLQTVVDAAREACLAADIAKPICPLSEDAE